MQHQFVALATCAAVFVFVILRRRARLSAIRDVPGPVNPSWIFGKSSEGQPGPFTSRRSKALNVKPLKDTNGISTPKKLEGQRRGSSRISGISFAGTALVVYVALLSNPHH